MTDRGDERTIDLGLPYLEQIEVIGSGGFSTVYKAYDSAHDRLVAVKVITLEQSEDLPRLRARFDRERRLAGRLGDHPNIVAVYTSGYLSSGQPFLLMEYMPGGSLFELLKRNGPLDWTRSLSILEPIAAAISYAHTLGVVHNDIKPENILLAGTEVRLADFGLGALRDESISTRAGRSLHYSPPELFLDGIRDQRSDVYSLGATLYALLAGQPPFRESTGEPEGRIIRRIIDDELSIRGNLDLTNEQADALERLMDKDPRRRPGDATTAINLLKHADNASAPKQSQPTISRRSRIAIAEAVHQRRRHWTDHWKTISLVVGVASLAVGIYSAAATLDSANSTSPTTTAPDDIRTGEESAREEERPPTTPAAPDTLVVSDTSASSSTSRPDDGESLENASRSLFSLLAEVELERSATDIAVNPEAGLMAVAGIGNHVEIYSADNGEFVGSLSGHVGRVSSIAFSTDGRHIGSASSDDRSVRQWSVETMTQTAGFQSGDRIPVVETIQASESEDSDFSILTNAPSLRHWFAGSTQGTAFICTFSGGGSSLDYNPASDLLAIGATSGRLILCDPSANRILASIASDDTSIQSVTFNGAGTTVAALGESGSVRIWDVDSMEVIAEILETDLSSSIALTPDQDRILVGTEQGDIHILDILGDTLQLVETIEAHEGPVRLLAYSSNGRRFVSSGDDARVLVWNVQS